MRKIKKLVATLLAATMVMAMGVTAFAADSLADGKYTAKQNLYKRAVISFDFVAIQTTIDVKVPLLIVFYQQRHFIEIFSYFVT